MAKDGEEKMEKSGVTWGKGLFSHMISNFPALSNPTSLESRYVLMSVILSKLKLDSYLYIRNIER